jgi:hypothetical protein
MTGDQNRFDKIQCHSKKYKQWNTQSVNVIAFHYFSQLSSGVGFSTYCSTDQSHLLCDTVLFQTDNASRVCTATGQKFWKISHNQLLTKHWKWLINIVKLFFKFSSGPQPPFSMHNCLVVIWLNSSQWTRLTWSFTLQVLLWTLLGQKMPIVMQIEGFHHCCGVYY